MPAELVPLMESNAPSINMDDADLVCHMVPGMIDDDNQPLPENIPTAIERQNNTPEFFSSWEHSGSCYWCLEGGRKNNARLSFNSDVQPTIEQLFEMFFFKQFIVATIIPQTNIQLEQQRNRPTSYGEFLRWLGLWFLMATIKGPDRSDFWSMTEVDCFVGAPLRLGAFMSRKRFDMILKAPTTTKHQTRSGNIVNPVIVLSCSPRTKNFWDHESSQQTVNIPNTNAFPAPKGYVPTAYVLQESIGVLNVSDITLHVPRTIFQHRAEFSG